MKKILIADDEEDITELIQLRLEASGYLVLTASNGQECLKKIALEKPDLLILDLKMPIIDGYGVLKTINENSVCDTIPVIVLTASADSRTKDLAVHENIRYFLTKPFKSQELLEKVNKIFDEQKS